ncbi:MAG: hypothetical protein QXX87_03785 [Candidatus Jordarchaeales archaeon]
MGEEEGAGVKLRGRRPDYLLVSLGALAALTLAVAAAPQLAPLAAAVLPALAAYFAWRLRPRALGGVVRRESAFLGDVVASWVGGRWRAYSMLQVASVPDVIRGDVKRFFRMMYLEGVPFFYHVRQGPASSWFVKGGREAAVRASGVWSTSIVIGVWGEGARLDDAVREARARAEKAKAFFEASFPHHRVELLKGGSLVDAVKECFP